jgi:hypothetical protein
MRNSTGPSVALALSSAHKLRQEVKLLRAERELLIDTDRARCRVLGSLLETGGVVADDVEEIDRLARELMKLHGNPDGSKPCACRLCRPETQDMDSGPDLKLEVVAEGKDHTLAPGNSLAIRAAVESTN